MKPLTKFFAVDFAFISMMHWGDIAHADVNLVIMQTPSKATRGQDVTHVTQAELILLRDTPKFSTGKLLTEIEQKLQEASFNSTDFFVRKSKFIPSLIGQFIAQTWQENMKIIENFRVRAVRRNRHFDLQRKFFWLVSDIRIFKPRIMLQSN